MTAVDLVVDANVKAVVVIDFSGEWGVGVDGESCSSRGLQVNFCEPLAAEESSFCIDAKGVSLVLSYQEVFTGEGIEYLFP